MKSIPREDVPVRQGLREFVFLDDIGAIRRLAGPWRALEDQSREPCFFQSFSWCGHVAQTQVRAYKDTYRPFVAVSLVDSEVRGIWPLSLRRNLWLWSLCNLDDPFGQFAGILAADQDEADALVSATMDHVRRGRLASHIRIERVIHDSPLHRALGRVAGLGVWDGERSSAPVVDLTGFQSFDAFRSSRNKKTMKNLRNMANRLERIGPTSATLARGGRELREIISRTFSNRDDWMRTRGLSSPAWRSSCHYEVISGGDSWGLDGLRIGFEMRSCGEPIAHQWGYVHNQRYYAYMSGLDVAQSQMSPGRLHLAKTIEQVFGEGVKAVELLTPASAYKMSWTDDVRELVDIHADLNVSGRVTSAVWDRGLRRALKAAYYRLPAFVRRYFRI